MIDRIEADVMDELIKTAKAEFVCRIGLQKRPVYLVDGHHYAKSIHFDDSRDECYYYINEAIIKLGKELDDESPT